MGAIPLLPTNTTTGNAFSNFGEGFNFGNGGIFNGFNQSAIPANAVQSQASGGFNTIPGMPGSSGTSTGMPDFSNLFPANGTSNSGNPLTSLFGSSSGIPGGNPAPGTTNGPTGLPQIQGSALKDLYGHGVGNALAQFLNSGAGFNMGVVQAEQNAAMPLEARGVSDIMNAMGSHGLSSSSTAAVGIGDFESQFNAQMENMFAQQYEQSVQNYISVLTGTAKGAQAQNAEGNSAFGSLSGLLSSIPELFTL